MMKQIQGLYTKFSKLSKRDRAALYASAVIIFVVVLDRAIIGPIYSRTLELDKSIVDKQAAIKRNLKILSQIDSIEKRKAEYRAFSVAETTPEQDTSSLFKEVDALASRSLINVADIKPQEPKKEQQFKKYQVNVSCEAPFDKLIEFLYNIENSKKVLKIEKFTLSLKSKQDTVLKCTMTISKVVLSEYKDNK